MSKTHMVSASEIFYFYTQSLRKLKAISKSLFYRKSPERLALVEWKRVRGFRMHLNPKTGQRIGVKNMSYVFSKWAKDHFYDEGHEICVSVTGWDFHSEERRTIFIYSPLYLKENTTFYIYRDYNERYKKISDIHEVMEGYPESIFQLEQNKVIKIINNINSLKIKRQSKKKGRIKVDHLRWINF